ncbi:MAG: O-methyltransferase [Candidatus Hodarchaeota archaeon]
MLHLSTQKVLLRLEEQDHAEREAKLDVSVRLRQIPRATGEFLYLFLASHAQKYFPRFLGLEIGSSGGYSTIWQGQALQALGHGKLISLDIDPRKIRLAQENIKEANCIKHLEVVQANAKDYLQRSPYQNFHYVFLDAEKEDYLQYYEMLVEKWLPKDAVIIADNVISHGEDLGDFLERVDNDDRVMNTTLPIGKGLSLIRRT